MLRNNNKNNSKPVFNTNLSDINFSDDSDLSSSHLSGLVENKKCFKIPFERAKCSEESFDRIFDELSQSPVPKNKKPRLTLLPERKSTKIIINERDEPDGNDVSFASPNFSHVTLKPKFSYCKKSVSAVNKENDAASNLLNMSGSSVDNSFSGLSIKKRIRFQMARPAITARRSVLLDSSNTSVNNSFLMPKKKRCKIFQRPVAEKVLTISSDNDSDCSYTSKSKRRKIFKMPPKIYNNEIKANRNDSIGDILDVSHDSSDFSLVRNRKLRKRFIMPLTDDQKVQLATISTVSDSDNVSDISTADLRKTICNRPKFKMPPKQNKSTTVFSDEDSSIELNGTKNQSNAESVEMLPSSSETRDNSFDSDTYIFTQSTINSPVLSSCNDDVSIEEVFSISEGTDKSYDENNTELENTISACSFQENDSSDLICSEDATLLENDSALKNTNSDRLLEDNKCKSIKPESEAKCGMVNVEVRKSKSDCEHNFLVQSSVDDKNKIYNNIYTHSAQRSTNKSKLNDNFRGEAILKDVLSTTDDDEKSYVIHKAESETCISNLSSDDCNTSNLVSSESVTLLTNDLIVENINCSRLSQTDRSDTVESDRITTERINNDESTDEYNLMVNSLVDNDNEIYNNATLTNRQSTQKTDLSDNSHDDVSVQEVFSEIDDDESQATNKIKSETFISNFSSDHCNTSNLVRSESVTLLENDLTPENINSSRLSQTDRSDTVKSDRIITERIDNDESTSEHNLMVNSFVDDDNEIYYNAALSNPQSMHKMTDLSDNSQDDVSVQEVYSVIDDSIKSYIKNHTDSEKSISNRSFDDYNTSDLVRSESVLLEKDSTLESTNCNRLSQNNKSDTVNCRIIEEIKDHKKLYESSNNLTINSLVDNDNEIYNNATLTNRQSTQKTDLSDNSHDVSVQEVFSVIDDDESQATNKIKSETFISNLSSDHCNTSNLVRSESVTLLENDLTPENINSSRLSQTDRSDRIVTEKINNDESTDEHNLMVNSLVDNDNKIYNNVALTDRQSTHKMDLSENSPDDVSVQEIFAVNDESHVTNNIKSDASISNCSFDDCNTSDLVRSESVLVEKDLTLESTNCNRLSQNNTSDTVNCRIIDEIKDRKKLYESSDKLTVNSLVDNDNEIYKKAASLTNRQSTHKMDDLSVDSHDDVSVQEVFSVIDDDESQATNKIKSETSISNRSFDNYNTSNLVRSESVTLLENDLTLENINCSPVSQTDRSDTVKFDSGITERVNNDESTDERNLMVNSLVDNVKEIYNNATLTNRQSTHQMDDLSDDSHDDVSVQEVFSVIDDSDKSHVTNKIKSETCISNRSFDNYNTSNLVRSESVLLEKDSTLESTNSNRLSQNNKSDIVNCRIIGEIKDRKKLYGNSNNLTVNSLVDNENETYNNATFTIRQSTRKSDLSDNCHDNVREEEDFSEINDGDMSYARNNGESKTSISNRSFDNYDTSNSIRIEAITLSETINCSRLSRTDRSDTVESDRITTERINNDESTDEHNLMVNSLVNSSNEIYNSVASTDRQSTCKTDQSDISHDDVSVQEVFSVTDDSVKSYVKSRADSEKSISNRSFDDCDISNLVRSESVTLLEKDLTLEKSTNCNRLSQNDKSDTVNSNCRVIEEIKDHKKLYESSLTVNSLVDSGNEIYNKATLNDRRSVRKSELSDNSHYDVYVQEAFSIMGDSDKCRVKNNAESDVSECSFDGCCNTSDLAGSELPSLLGGSTNSVRIHRSRLSRNDKFSGTVILETVGRTIEGLEKGNIDSDDRSSIVNSLIAREIGITSGNDSNAVTSTGYRSANGSTKLSCSGDVSVEEVFSVADDSEKSYDRNVTNSSNETGGRKTFGNATFTVDRAAMDATLNGCRDDDVGITRVYSLPDSSGKLCDKNTVKNSTCARLYTDCSTIYGDSATLAVANERTLVDVTDCDNDRTLVAVTDCDNDRLPINKCDSVGSPLFESTAATIGNENEDDTGCENKPSADTENRVFRDNNLTFTGRRRSIGGSSTWNSRRSEEVVVAEPERSSDGSKSESFVINCSFDDGGNSNLSSRYVSVGSPDSANRSLDNDHDKRLRSDYIDSFSKDAIARCGEDDAVNVGKSVIGSDKAEVRSNHLISPKLLNSDGTDASKLLFAANENTPVAASSLSGNRRDGSENAGRLPKDENVIDAIKREEGKIDDADESGSTSKNDEDEIHYSKDPNFTKCSSDASSYKSIVDSLIKARCEETDSCTDIIDFTCDCPSDIASSSRIIELSRVNEKSSDSEISCQHPDKLSRSQIDADDDDLPTVDTDKRDDEQQQQRRQRLEKAENSSGSDDNRHGYFSEQDSARSIGDVRPTLADVKLNEINNSLLKSDLFAVIDDQQNVLDYSEIGIADETNFPKNPDENETAESANVSLSKSDNYAETNSSSFKSTVGDSTRISGHSDSIGLSLYASGRLSSLVLSADSATTSGLSLYASGRLSNSTSADASNEDDNSNDRENFGTDNGDASNRSKVARKTRSSVRLSAGNRSGTGTTSGRVANNSSVLSVRGSPPYSLRQRTSTATGRNLTVTSAEKLTKMTTRSSTKNDNGKEYGSLSDNRSKTSVSTRTNRTNSSNLSFKTSIGNSGGENSDDNLSFKTSIGNSGGETSGNLSFKTSIGNSGGETSGNLSFKVPLSNTGISGRRSRSSEKTVVNSSINSGRSCSVQSRPSRTRNKKNINNTTDADESERNRSIKNRSSKSVNDKISISVVEDSVPVAQTSTATATVIGGTSISLVTKVFGKRSATPIIEDSMVDVEPRGADIPPTRKNQNRSKRASKNVRFPKFSYWCTKRLYSHILEKINSEYGIRSNRKLLQIVRYLNDQVNLVISLSDGYDEIIAEIKLMLAEQNVIISTFDFYQFCHSYMPIRFVNKAVPIIQPFGRPLNISFDPSNLFKPIINLQVSAERSNSSASE